MAEESPALRKSEPMVDQTTPVAELQLSVRVSNCLKNDNVRTVGELTALSAAELLRMPNFGRRSLAEVEAKLADHRLSLSATGRALEAFNRSKIGAVNEPAYPSLTIAQQLIAIMADNGVINARRIVWWYVKSGIVLPVAADNDVEFEEADEAA